jgi:hypothetical protein
LVEACHAGLFAHIADVMICRALGYFQFGGHLVGAQPAYQHPEDDAIVA